MKDKYFDDCIAECERLEKENKELESALAAHKAVVEKAKAVDWFIVRSALGMADGLLLGKGKGITVRNQVEEFYHALSALAEGEGKEKVMIPVETFKEAIPDGLTIACPYCGRVPEIDYMIDDEIWKQLIPKEYRTGVVCLGCLAKLARQHKVAWVEHIQRMYWGSPQTTLELRIEKIYLPKNKEAK